MIAAGICNGTKARHNKSRSLLHSMRNDCFRGRLHVAVLHKKRGSHRWKTPTCGIAGSHGFDHGIDVIVLGHLQNLRLHDEELTTQSPWRHTSHGASVVSLNPTSHSDMQTPACSSMTRNRAVSSSTRMSLHDQCRGAEIRVGEPQWISRYRRSPGRDRRIVKVGWFEVSVQSRASAPRHRSSVAGKCLIMSSRLSGLALMRGRDTFPQY